MKAMSVVLMIALAAAVVWSCEPSKKDDAAQPTGPRDAVLAPSDEPASRPAYSEAPPPPPPVIAPSAGGSTVAAPAVTAPAAKGKEKNKKGAKQEYTVQAGDTLASISTKFYGDAKEVKKIADANKGKIKNDQVTAGETITIPAK